MGVSLITRSQMVDEFGRGKARRQTSSWSMMFSENRYPLFGIML
jgi:hypothetical protein